MTQYNNYLEWQSEGIQFLLKKSQIGISFLSIYIRTYIYILVYTDQTAYVRGYRTQTVISRFIINRHVSTDNHESRQASTLHDSPVTRLFYLRRLVLYLLKRFSLRLFHASIYKQHRVKFNINSFKRQLSDGYRIQSYKLDKKPDPKGTYRIPRMLRNLIESLELDRNDQTVNLKHRTLFLFLFSRAMFNRRMKRQVKFASKDPSLVAWNRLQFSTRVHVCIPWSWRFGFSRVRTWLSRVSAILLDRSPGAGRRDGASSGVLGY